MYRFLGNKIAAVYSGYIGNFPDITAFFCAIFCLLFLSKIYTFQFILLYTNRIDWQGTS